MLYFILSCPLMQRAAFFWAKTKSIYELSLILISLRSNDRFAYVIQIVNNCLKIKKLPPPLNPKL